LASLSVFTHIVLDVCVNVSFSYFHLSLQFVCRYRPLAHRAFPVMIKTVLELLIFWSLLFDTSAAEWSWNLTDPYGPATKPGTQQVFNSTGGFRYVDPFIGSAGGMDDAGHVFPGASLPFGMVKAVADTLSRDNHGGFAVDDSAIYGFSHMHDSGMDSLQVAGRIQIANIRCRNWWCK
jgi:hypothetical protein